MIHATVYTDCSYHPTTRTGAYAIYIRCGETVERLSGDLPKKVLESKHPVHLGELYGICQGIKCAVAKFGVHLVYLRTDSLQALRWITGTQKGEAKELVDWLKGFIDKYNVTIQFKKVAAHQEDESVQTWVNNWCDMTAKHRATQLFHLKKKEMIGKRYKSSQGIVILESIKGNKMICFRPGNNKRKFRIAPGKFHSQYKLSKKSK